MSKQVI